MRVKQIDIHENLMRLEDLTLCDFEACYFVARDKFDYFSLEK